MNVENTSAEGVSDIKVEIKLENESEDEVESERDLYTDHVIKDEMVVGPVVIQLDDMTYCPKEKSLWGEHNYCRIQNEYEVELSQVMEPSDLPVLKKPKLETTDEETDQVKPQKGMKEDNTEGIISNVNFKTNSSTNIKTIDAAEKPFACYCGYKCRQKGILKIHLRSHTGEKPYSCAHCDYKCSRKESLPIHLSIHTGVKAYSCSYCDYKCRTKGRLSEHLRTHTGERPYPCSYCDYKCNTKGELTLHMRKHTGEKRYACSHCDYKCNLNHRLLVHLRIHTGEKPYSCTECNYKTAHKNSLDMHFLKHFTPQIVKEALSMMKKP